MPKKRLDDLIIARELAESINKARALIMAGEVIVEGKIISKPGIMLDNSVTIELVKKSPYVSRGGIKLAHALEEFKIDVSSLTMLDIGASTGGFTDCLLQHGAKKVYAIDVGYGQLDYKLRSDPRVTVLDRTNARLPFELPESADMATIDVSFISVTRVIPNVASHLKSAGQLLVLLKPQFEAERGEVEKGGIVKDPQVHALVIARFMNWAIENGYRFRGLTTSPILGAEGNKEFFILLRRN